MPSSPAVPCAGLPEWSEELPLGLFCDESPHFFYLFRAFGGDVRLTDVVVKESRKKPATPHLVTAHLDTDLAPAFLYCSFESSVSEWYFILICEKAVADHRHLPGSSHRLARRRHAPRAGHDAHLADRHLATLARGRALRVAAPCETALLRHGRGGESLPRWRRDRS